MGWEWIGLDGKPGEGKYRALLWSYKWWAVTKAWFDFVAVIFESQKPKAERKKYHTAGWTHSHECRMPPLPLPDVVRVNDLDDLGSCAAERWDKCRLPAASVATIDLWLPLMQMHSRPFPHISCSTLPSPTTTPLPPPNPPIPGIVYLPTLFHLAIQLNLGDTLLSVGVQNCRKCRREETRPRKQCNSYIFYCFLDKLSAEATRYHLLGLAMFEYELLKLVRSRWRLLKQLVLAFWKSWRSWNNSFLQRSFLQVQVAPIQ